MNRVNYSAWRRTDADRKALQRYISGLEQAVPARLARAEAFAFWANLYNALTLRLIFDRYPVRSIREIRPSLLSLGPWKTPLASVHGANLSLDDIEHGVLRKQWRDLRVHYAVNCASIGCPNLPLRAFRGASLQADLDRCAVAYVNHPRGARVAGGRLVVSSIYNWYKADFGGADSGVIAHLRRYARSPLAMQLNGITGVFKHEYDWSLNDTARG